MYQNNKTNHFFKSNNTITYTVYIYILILTANVVLCQFALV